MLSAPLLRRSFFVCRSIHFNMKLTETLNRRQKRTAVSIAVLVGFFILCLVIDPKRYISSVYNGMLLFATSVAPALFPFFFFTRILTSVGTAQMLGDALKKPIARLYNCPSVGGYVFFMSAISGYPVGSRLLSDLYSAGIIDRRQVKAISAFTSTSGPLFIVGTVGTVMFGSASFGYLLMAIHFVGALLNGFIYRIRKRDAKEYAELLRTPPDFDDLLGKSMTSALTSLFIVGGYIAIFSMIADVMTDIGVVDALAAPLSSLYSLLGWEPEMAHGTVLGFIEITRGCLSISRCGAQIKTALPVVAGLLSFGGISVSLQSLTFLGNCKIRPLFYFATKATQAVISFALAWLVSLAL